MIGMQREVKGLGYHMREKGESGAPIMLRVTVPKVKRATMGEHLIRWMKISSANVSLKM